MTINSQLVYSTLQSALDDAERQIHEAGFEGQLAISIFAGSYFASTKHGFKFSLASSNDEIKVKGKDLQACVDEFIHRAGFKRQQEQLQIGHVTVEQAAPALDDEIPF